MSKAKATLTGTTRKQFLAEVTGMVSTASSLAAEGPAHRPKVLAVVAHPDDKYAFAAFAYRLTHEARGVIDQVVITNGEAGFRYSQLAEAYYGLTLTEEAIGRDRLPAVRREEAQRAGRILGIRNQWFLGRRDARFTLDGSEAFSGIWDTQKIGEFLSARLKRERYDFVVVMLPTQETHGHHQAAAVLAAETILGLPTNDRPVLIAAEPSGTEVPQFRPSSDIAVLRSQPAPGWRVNRLDCIPQQPALNYAVVVNWVICEHKSQGLFQTDAGKHQFENFWLFDTGAPDDSRRADDFFALLKQQTRSRL